MTLLPPYLEQWYTHEKGDMTVLGILAPTVAKKMRSEIRRAFVIQLENELADPKRAHILQKERIWDFMENHGIEYDETNWQAIDKIHQRYRISVCGHLLRAA